MPSGHHELLVGHISKVNSLEVGDINTVIPKRTFKAPSHHTKTARRDAPITAFGSPLFGDILLNNNELGKISKEQRAGEWDVWQTSLTNPNIANYVTSCGGLGIRVTARSELDDAISRALAFEGPATVEIMTAPELV